MVTMVSEETPTVEFPASRGGPASNGEATTVEAVASGASSDQSIRTALELCGREGHISPGEAEAFWSRYSGLQGQLVELTDKLRRAQAECANITKRLTQQNVEAHQFGGISLARAILPVLDNLERTLASQDAGGGGGPFIEGVELIRAQLVKTLREFGVEPIESLGRPFDPHLHQAMIQDRQTDRPPGTITQEFECGYRIHDRVLRPAKVAVAAAPMEDA